mmetsp:Transcript_19779/g.30366  ORF Transcript_19779/g.30366 Transcript_19779/m.30366 type:complete len:250 (+) Transcript_19779:803-1552(+)
MVSPHVTPRDGITDYISDRTQGPACALACPAATLYRNYFANGTGQGDEQIDCLKDAGDVIGNQNNEYWIMKNGYALPTSAAKMKELGARLRSQMDTRPSDYYSALAKLRVGVQWNTEVSGSTGESSSSSKTGRRKGPQCVTQVYCSALPIAYTNAIESIADVEPLARMVLDATYDATLGVAAILSIERKQRVNVYLTKVGGGVFGNRDEWITDAIKKSLQKYSFYGLNVFLVHYGSPPFHFLEQLEEIR